MKTFFFRRERFGVMDYVLELLFSRQNKNYERNIIHEHKALTIYIFTQT
jgi:hypothetical protein